MEEFWAPLLGHYDVSDQGRVRRRSSGRILKTRVRPNGYVEIGLCCLHGQRWRRVHHLVLEAFVGPRPVRHEANHKNGIKADNRPSNLEWVTPQQNTRHAIDVLKIPRARGEKNPAHKLSTEQVQQLREKYRRGMGTLRSLGREFGVSASTVGFILRRLKWAHVA